METPETNAATCEKCGSTRLRRARSHHFGHRWVRDWTDWDRYACRACGYRGWRHGKVVEQDPSQVPAGPQVPRGRSEELRDSRLRRRIRIRVVLTMVLGLLLGVATAWLVLRMTSAIQPPQE